MRKQHIVVNLNMIACGDFASLFIKQGMNRRFLIQIGLLAALKVGGSLLEALGQSFDLSLIWFKPSLTSSIPSELW